jgi:hypothetical protein
MRRGRWEASLPMSSNMKHLNLNSSIPSTKMMPMGMLNAESGGTTNTWCLVMKSVEAVSTMVPSKAPLAQLVYHSTNPFLMLAMGLADADHCGRL